MAIKATRLMELHQARQDSRVQPFEGLIEQIESQLDHDLRGGWGDIREEVLDERDPRNVRLEFTTELDPGVVDELAALGTDDLAVVQRELQRRYLDVGYRSLELLDDGRVRLEHVIGPA